MKEVSELRAILGQYLDWNKARLDCFTQALLSLFITRTVNLSELAIGMASATEIASRYKRLKRFFAQITINYDMIALLIFKLFFSGKEIYLTIDRTNWFWGKSKINILTLAVAYEGVAVPLFWNLLNKAGNATALEHEQIIKRFIKLFGKLSIVGVLGDREFASESLFRFLNKNRIPFYIRIKESVLVKVKKSRFSTPKKLFSNLKVKQKSAFQMSVWVFNQKLYLSGSRSERGELMIVATNQNPTNAISIYLRRWEIECLFSCLKSRGFRFEDTHLTHRDRIEKMMALLAIGFCWSHKTGEWRAAMKPIPFWKHYNGIRPQNSYFRYGLDYIRDIIVNPFKKIADFREILALLRLDHQAIEPFL